MPAVNQIEVHPYFLNEEVRAYGEQHGIRTEAWSPIAQGAVLDDPVITEIAAPAGPDPGPGRAALAHPARQHRVPQVRRPRRGSRRTSSCSTSSSTTDDMAAIAALDKGEDGRTGPDPDSFAFIPD